jgi:hypothetical protein
MDIDCDGAQGGPADDGRCGNSDDTQDITAFADTVKAYKKGISDLNANVHPYVVFGNSGSKAGYKTFDPQQYGVEPLSVMAVVCGDQLVCSPPCPLPQIWHEHADSDNAKIYGVWGDENGDDGAHPMVGEASISLATACYGTSMTGDNGHDPDDVLYIAFPGSDAVPGANGADWAAANYAAFESSITALGDTLIARIGSTSGGGGGTTPPPTCSWAGHCAGEC